MGTFSTVAVGVVLMAAGLDSWCVMSGRARLEPEPDPFAETPPPCCVGVVWVEGVGVEGVAGGGWRVDGECSLVVGVVEGRAAGAGDVLSRMSKNTHTIPMFQPTLEKTF